jgi:hypothetical protein
LSDPEVTHVAVAFDHVIESFRNKMYKGYKSSVGVDPIILNQFPLAEKVIKALGLVVWPMVKFEADDAIATAVVRFKKIKFVEQVVICSVDKDLTQMVDGKKVVVWDRRREIVLDEEGVAEKFGVSPESTATVLAKYKHLELIPKDPNKLDLGLGRATTLLESLQQNYQHALLFRELSALRTDVPLKETLNHLKWTGAYPRLKKICHELGDERILERVSRWR